MCCTRGVAFFCYCKKIVVRHTETPSFDLIGHVEENVGFTDSSITAARTILLLGACILRSPWKLLSGH